MATANCFVSNQVYTSLKSGPFPLSKCSRCLAALSQVKKVLTTNPEAPINVECIMNDVDAHGVITREQFEEEAKPVLDRLLAPVQKVGLLVWGIVNGGRVTGVLGKQQVLEWLKGVLCAASLLISKP
jgi:hypothetical protein